MKVYVDTGWSSRSPWLGSPEQCRSSRGDYVDSGLLRGIP